MTIILDNYNYPPSTLQGLGLGGRKNPRIIVGENSCHFGASYSLKGHKCRVTSAKPLENSDGVRVRFRVRFQAVKVQIFGGFPVESPTKKANRLKALLRGISLSGYGSERFQVRLRGLSEYGSVAYLFERPTRETQGEQYLDTALGKFHGPLQTPSEARGTLEQNPAEASKSSSEKQLSLASFGPRGALCAWDPSRTFQRRRCFPGIVTGMRWTGLPDRNND